MNPQTPEQPEVNPQPPVQPPEPVVTPQVSSSYNEPTTSVTPVVSNPISSPFGASSEPVQPVVGLPTDNVSPKKPVNKKLFIIIAVIIVVIGLIIAAVMMFLPNVASQVTGGVASLSNSSPAALTTYEGKGYSISVPKDFKPLEASSGSTTAINFNKDGKKTSDPVSAVSIITSSYAGTTRENMIAQFDTTATGYTIPDSDTSKDNKTEKVTVQGFTALKATSTMLNNGAETLKVTSTYVFADKGFYLISISVAIGDTGKIDASTILNSLKIVLASILPVSPIATLILIR